MQNSTDTAHGICIADMYALRQVSEEYSWQGLLHSMQGFGLWEIVEELHKEGNIRLRALLG